MKKITSIIELRTAVSLLEQQQKEEGLLLKKELLFIYESLTPSNIIKSTFKTLASAPDFKEDLINSTLSVAVGYFSKKALIGTSNNPIKQLLGNLVQTTVSSIVSKNADELKLSLMELLSTIFSKKEKQPYK